MALSIVPPTPRALTRDLPNVPPLVQYVLGVFLEPILAWLGAQVYRAVLSRCATHPLGLWLPTRAQKSSVSCPGPTIAPWVQWKG